jgi:hypothetical protein
MLEGSAFAVRAAATIEPAGGTYVPPVGPSRTRRVSRRGAGPPFAVGGPPLPNKQTKNILLRCSVNPRL